MEKETNGVEEVIENATQEEKTQAAETKPEDVKTEEKEEQETKAPAIDIDEIVNKALDKKEKSILKSIFKQQGVKDEDIEGKIAEYKKAQEGTLEDKLAKKDEEIKAATEAAEKAREAIKSAAIASEIAKAGISEKKAELFAKLIDATTVTVNDNFAVDTTGLKKRINEILETVPEFKEVKKETGIKIGAQKQIEQENAKRSYSLRDGVRATINR